MRNLVQALVVVALVVPAVAAAQPRNDEEALAYTRAVQRGHDGAKRADWQTATDGYGEAASIRPRSGEPVLFQAMMLRARGDLPGALARFREAARLTEATGQAEDGARAKALLGIAMVLESQRQFPDARTAFQAYVSFAESHGSVTTYPAVGRARVQAIDRVDELDQAYREVRERIAARERENSRGGRGGGGGGGN
jgi:tetratricopeptide (TPR) repeat protein